MKKIWISISFHFLVLLLSLPSQAEMSCTSLFSKPISEAIAKDSVIFDVRSVSNGLSAEERFIVIESIDELIQVFLQLGSKNPLIMSDFMNYAGLDIIRLNPKHLTFEIKAQNESVLSLSEKHQVTEQAVRQRIYQFDSAIKDLLRRKKRSDLLNLYLVLFYEKDFFRLFRGKRMNNPRTAKVHKEMNNDLKSAVQQQEEPSDTFLHQGVTYYRKQFRNGNRQRFTRVQSASEQALVPTELQEKQLAEDPDLFFFKGNIFRRSQIAPNRSRSLGQQKSTPEVKPELTSDADDWDYWLEFHGYQEKPAETYEDLLHHWLKNL